MLLSSLRVLDLTDDRGQLCGHILAQLGAEVIVVEPPGGNVARQAGPFAVGADGTKSSLYWQAFARGKRSLTLDIDQAADRDRLFELAGGADILIESAGAGVMAGKGLGYDDLAAANPALIVVSISPFGSDGPKARWAATDLTVVAAGGQMALTGDDDRAPLRITLPQSFHHASLEGAMGALIALYERQHRSGLGQLVDVSAQQAVLQASQSMMLAGFLNATRLTRVAGGLKNGPLHLQLMWPCKDGYVSVTFLFGGGIGPFTRNLMSWAFEEGFCDEATRDKDWVNYGVLLVTGQEPVAEYERVKRAVGQFLATKTKAELLAASFERRLLITPVADTAEVLASPQFADRGFWQDVDGVPFPGALAKLSETPLPSLGRAPHPGEHTGEVLAEPRRSPAVPLERAPTTDEPPLAGLKVLDLMWVMAGPAGSRVLADYGAQIVRVESANRIDTARTLMPYRNNSSDPNDSGLYNNMNAGKLGLALDMSKPGAKEVILDLVQWADVVLESFSPRAMKGWGLDYESLRAVKPDIIMLSSCLMGQTGPYTALAGFGTMAAAISGYFNITGWADRAPCGPFAAYTDYVSPRLLTACLLAAVEHRRATGQGQYIDLSQAEASMPLLAPALLQTALSGQVYQRGGNDDEFFAPHGVYRCAGEDRWVAIAVTGDGEWASLAGLLGRSDLAGMTAQDRRERRRELDTIVEAWTQSRDAEEVTETLQALGVAAHGVQNTGECRNDAQLAHRNHFVEVAHASQGTTWVEGTRFHLSRTPARIRSGGPLFGEHTWDILSGFLGYDDERIGDLAAAELLE